MCADSPVYLGEEIALGLQTMNACFKEPLVQSSRGGSKRGGAALTATGQAVVAAYRSMEADSLRALDAAWQEILPAGF
jgi:molybdate transport system regulatory protein